MLEEERDERGARRERGRYECPGWGVKEYPGRALSALRLELISTIY